MQNKHRKFVTDRGVRYTIHHYTERNPRFELWRWSNPKSGWAFTYECTDYQEAYNFMLSISSEVPVVDD